MARGDQLRGAMRQDPRAGLVRVSPGVYRNQGGQLTNQRGRPMARRGDGRDRADMIGQQLGQFAPYPIPRPQREGDYDFVDRRPAPEGFRGTANVDPGPYGRRAIDQFWGAVAEDAGDKFLDRVNMPPSDIQDGLGRTMGANNDTGWQGQRPIMSFENQFQPSANRGGRYRLSPGVYGTREQAERVYNKQQQAMQEAYELYGKPADVEQGRPNQGVGNYFGRQAEGAWDVTKTALDPRTAYDPRRRAESVGRRIRKMF